MDRKNKSRISGTTITGEPENTELREQIPTGEFTPTEETGSSSAGSRTTSGTTETELNPPKRKRGRPTGGTNLLQETINLQEEEVNFKGSSKTFKSTKSGKFLSEEEALSTANFILSTVNDLAVNFIDEKAGFEPLELTLLSMSLPKYLETLELSTIDKGSKMLYPLMGLLGVGIYSLRVTNIVLDKRKQNKNKEPKPFAENNIKEVNEVPEYSTEDVNSSSNQVNANGIKWEKGRVEWKNGLHGI